MNLDTEALEAASDALRCSEAKCDEGKYEPLGDLLGFSGENAARIVCREGARAAITAYLSAMAEKGFRMMPREATRDMTLAWAIKSEAFKGTGAAHQHAREVWSAMFDAATKEPQ